MNGGAERASLGTVHFLGSREISEFLDSPASASIDAQPYLFRNSSWAWIAQTAVELRQRGVDVSAGSDYRAGVVNFGLAADIRRLSPRPDVFKVSIDADQLRPRWANLALVQNQKQAGRWAFWVPHWPQPGLVPRDPQRTGFRTVGFFGLARNLCRPPEWWEQLCMAHGLEFRLKDSSEWHDYSDIDVAVALRDFSCRRHHDKPPTKMFNAWLAGVVFMGGCDSAYTQAGVEGRNFLRCRTEGDLVQSLRDVRNNPDWAQGLVRNGAEAATRVGSREATAERWLMLIEDEVLPRFWRWQQAPEFIRQGAAGAGRLGDWTVRQRNAAWRLTKRIMRRR